MKKSLGVLIHQSGVLADGISAGQIKDLLEDFHDTIAIRTSHSDVGFLIKTIEMWADAIKEANDVGDIEIKFLVITSEVVYGSHSLHFELPESLALKLKQETQGVSLYWAIFDTMSDNARMHSHLPQPIDFCFERFINEDPNITLANNIRRLWKEIFPED